MGNDRLLTTISLVLLLLAGCRPHPPEPAAPPPGRNFGSVFQTLQNPFFVELNEGIKEVVAAHGDRLTTLDSQWNSSKQDGDVADLASQDVTAIFVNPVSWEGVKESLVQAQRKGLLCVVVDAPVSDAKPVLCQVASDNVEAGRMAARALAKVRRTARVVILHIPQNKACIDRINGFEEELAKHPNMQVLGVWDGKGTVEGSHPAMAELLDKHPDLNAVFAVNDPSALGAVKALEAAGKAADVTVVSVDGSPEGIAAVKAGKLYATAAQFPREIGRIAAQRVYEHLEGRPVEKDIKVPVELITRDNVNAFSSH